MNKEHLQKFRVLVGELSPENLHEDGEISNWQANRKEKKLLKQWNRLEKDVGRKVTEDEIWNGWYEDDFSDPNKIRFDFYVNEWTTTFDNYQ
tara:strand:- start:137 stop:412 length:276 start_codon:yes stop_codon:yes gene_type:complete